MHAHSFRILSWNSASRPGDPSFFFHHFVPHICISIWHFENYRALFWNQGYSEKGDLPEHFASTISLVMPFSQNSWPYRSSTYREVINESQGDLNSSKSNYFPLCPPWSISNTRLFFEVSSSIFCANLAEPIISYHSFSNFGCACHTSMIYPGNCSPAPS